jgi:hypothetical protein
VVATTTAKSLKGPIVDSCLLLVTGSFVEIELVLLV